MGVKRRAMRLARGSWATAAVVATASVGGATLQDIASRRRASSGRREAMPASRIPLGYLPRSALTGS